jgi:probable HAF family extracellular repeat protein
MGMAALTVIALLTVPGRVAARGPAKAAEASAAIALYSITDLGTLGGSFSRANAINSRGQIVGGSYNRTPDPTIAGSNEVRAVLWDRGRKTDLGTLGGPDANQINGNVTGASGINDSGQVVGGATYNAEIDPACNSDAQQAGEACNHAFLWARGQLTFLGTLGGVTDMGNSFSLANAINDRGQIVGASFVKTPDPNNPGKPQVHAFLWARGKMTELGALPGQLSTYSQAFAINDRGQVVGESGFRDAEGHPFIWSKGVMTDIGTQGGPTGCAQASNNEGQVVGFADTTVPDSSNPGRYLSHAFVWAGGKAQDLGRYGKDQDSQANSINDRDLIVGFSANNAGFRAVLWQGGSIIDLNTRIPAHSGWKLNGANAINDRGQIVGTGVNPHSRNDAFLLTPVTTTR